MKRKKLIAIIIAASSLIGCSNLSASEQLRIVADPVGDYRQSAFATSSIPGDHIIKLEVDVDNDGKKDIFLSCDKSCLHDHTEYENNVYTWRLYRNLGNGRYAVLDRQRFKNPGAEFLEGSFDFDPEKAFVGFIKEANAYGLLAMYLIPKHNKALLSAYVLRVNYFEMLNFPDPEKPSEVYHYDIGWDVPDLPDAYKRYFVKPLEKPVMVP